MDRDERTNDSDATGRETKRRRIATPAGRIVCDFTHPFDTVDLNVLREILLLVGEREQISLVCKVWATIAKNLFPRSKLLTFMLPLEWAQRGLLSKFHITLFYNAESTVMKIDLRPENKVRLTLQHTNEESKNFPNTGWMANDLEWTVSIPKKESEEKPPRLTTQIDLKRYRRLADVLSFRMAREPNLDPCWFNFTMKDLANPALWATPMDDPIWRVVRSWKNPSGAYSRPVTKTPKQLIQKIRKSEVVCFTAKSYDKGIVVMFNQRFSYYLTHYERTSIYHRIMKSWGF